MNQLITKKRTRYYLKLKELVYNKEEEYIMKDIKRQLSVSIIKQIGPLYDNIPFVPFLTDIDETKRLNRILEDKLNMFIVNEAKGNKASEGYNNDDYDNNNNTFLTKSFFDNIIDNDVFIQQPMMQTSQPPQQSPRKNHYHSSKTITRHKMNSNHLGASSSEGGGVNDSIEEISRFIVFLQYSEDVRKIDNTKKRTQVDLLLPQSWPSSEKSLIRQDMRKNTIQKANKEVNEKVLKEEMKYEKKIIEETKREIRKKKFKQTKTFFLRFNQEAKKIKEQRGVFSDILQTFLTKASQGRDFSNTNANYIGNDNNNNYLLVNNSLSNRFTQTQSQTKRNRNANSSDRIIKKHERFNPNMSAISVLRAYPEIDSQKRYYCRLSLNKTKPFKTSLSRNIKAIEGRYDSNTSVKFLRSSTNSTMTKPVRVFNRLSDNSQSSRFNIKNQNSNRNRINNKMPNISDILKGESFRISIPLKGLTPNI